MNSVRKVPTPEIGSVGDAARRRSGARQASSFPRLKLTVEAILSTLVDRASVYEYGKLLSHIVQNSMLVRRGSPGCSPYRGLSLQMPIILATAADWSRQRNTYRTYDLQKLDFILSEPGNGSTL